MKDKAINGLITLTILSIAFCTAVIPAQAAYDLTVTDYNLNALKNQGQWASYGSGELLMAGYGDSISGPVYVLDAPYQKVQTVGIIRAITMTDYAGSSGYWGECASFVKALSKSTVSTSKWIKGYNVVASGNIKPGTIIATFNSNGYYGHVAVFRDYVYSNGIITGIKVWDQNWLYKNPGLVGRHNLLKSGTGVSDADNYYVVQL